MYISIKKYFIFKLKIVLILSISLFSGSNNYAQSQKNDTNLKLKKLFFNLNIDTCLKEIVKEIDSNKIFKFEFDGRIDTYKIGQRYIIFRNDIALHPYFKLVNNKQALTECDSTKISIQPNFIGRGLSHGKIDYNRLYGHSVSLNMFLHDSILAMKAYHYLRDSISKEFKRYYTMGTTMSDNIIFGEWSKIIIDSKNNGYEYQRILNISLETFNDIFILTITFSKETVINEICNEN